MEPIKMFMLAFAGAMGLVAAYTIFEAIKAVFYSVGMILGAQKTYNDEIQKLRALKDLVAQEAAANAKASAGKPTA